ncbi:MAG: NifU family protein [Candidatus Omnitrophota bacterium]|jgi:Fe-S cluster biogenesis protein NfuA
MNSDEVRGTLRISPEVTPNPATVKFAVNRVLLPSGSCNFPDRTQCEGSALAAKLFENPSVAGVLIGPDFVAVTKSTDADWRVVMQPVFEALRDFLASGAEAVDPEKNSGSEKDLPQGAAEGRPEERVRALIEREIRPVLAGDGGDVEFRGYEDGVVRLRLQGACRSCPSATQTLKSGIEAYLKRMIPEVKEVVQV